MFLTKTQQRTGRTVDIHFVLHMKEDCSNSHKRIENGFLYLWWNSAKISHDKMFIFSLRNFFALPQIYWNFTFCAFFYTTRTVVVLPWARLSAASFSKYCRSSSSAEQNDEMILIMILIKTRRNAVHSMVFLNDISKTCFSPKLNKKQDELWK